MNKRIILFGIALLGLPSILPAQVRAGEEALVPLGRAPRLDPVATDHVVVRFEETAARAQEDAALAAAGVTTAEDGAADYVVVDTAGRDAAEVVAELLAQPAVAEAYLDPIATATAWTEDPMVVGPDFDGWYDYDLMRLPRAWDVTRGAGTVVAVLDTGVRATHEDLAGAVLPGWDFVNDDADADDDHGHGTAVAGVVGARANNGLGAVGAAYETQILPVKVLNAQGRGSMSDIAEGVTWAVAHGADVINLSLAGLGEAPQLLAAIEAAVAAGVVVVAAAGNEGTDEPQYPAAYAADVDGLLAVSATDFSGALTDFSSFGDATEIAAPGWFIPAPYLGADSGYGPYTLWSGTSFSAPFVAGAAALVMSRGTTAPAVVEDRLLDSARDAGPRGVDPFYGRGVVDAAAALGLGAAVPIDRAADDEGADDDTIGRAQPLPVGGVTGTLSPEGDVDWYRFDATGVGQLTATVYALDLPLMDGLASVRPRVEVRAGDTVLARAQAAKGADSIEVSFEVPAVGPLDIAVSNVNGSAPSSAYSVSVSSVGRNAQFDVASMNLAFGTRTYLGDVTDDGAPDLVSLTPSGTSVAVRVNSGAGTYGSAPVSVPLGGTMPTSPTAVIADVDGDGDQDVLVGTTTGVALLRQGGDGTLTAAGVTAWGTGPVQMEAADMDGDGDTDVVVSRTTGGASTQVLVNDGTGAFAAGTQVAAAGFLEFALGDLSRDGRTDLVTYRGARYTQQADGSFVVSSSSVVAADVAVGDLDGDTYADIAYSLSGNPGTYEMYTSDGAGAWNLLSMGIAGQVPEPLALADVDGNGRQDLVVGNSGWNQLSVVFGRAGGGFTGYQTTDGVPYSSHYDTDTIAVADVDGDGWQDVFLSSTQGVVAVAFQVPRVVGDPSWVVDASPRAHAAGVGARPTVSVELDRGVVAGSVTSSTVRLLDGLTAEPVAASVGHDAGTHTVTLTPTADLVPGRHYAIHVAGLEDGGGAAQPAPYWTWFTVGAAGERFSPMTPVRVLDTRFDRPIPVSPGAPVELPLGGAWVPEDATAVVLNVTAVAPSSVGNVRVYPTPDDPRDVPLVSNLNVVPGVDQPNLVTVALGVDGSVTLATDGMTANLIADLAGYYREGGSTAYVPVDPVRAMDTRDGTGGVPRSAVALGRWVDLQVTGRDGVPADASAVVLNVTAVAPSGTTNVRVYPRPADSEWQEPPTVSNLNLRAGRDQPNLVTVMVGDGGRVRFYTQSATVHLVADLAGYYSPTGDHGYVPLAPTRIADSRSALGLAQLTPGVTRSLQVTGVAGVPADAAAAVLNVTAVGPSSFSNVRVFPANTTGTVPLVSNLNVVAGRDEPNLVLVRLGEGGRVSFYSQSARLHTVVDVAGYFRRFAPTPG